jgi:predicted RNA-binding Zn-ribbon protein involved in translation (DUF1610 family)
MGMPVSDDMRDEDLEFECPNCGCLIIKGSWLKVISAFTCTQCETRVRIGYPSQSCAFRTEEEEFWSGRLIERYRLERERQKAA